LFQLPYAYGRLRQRLRSGRGFSNYRWLSVVEAKTYRLLDATFI